VSLLTGGAGSLADAVLAFADLQGAVGPPVIVIVDSWLTAGGTDDFVFAYLFATAAGTASVVFQVPATGFGGLAAGAFAEPVFAAADWSDGG
jgi:hypothetical protein